MKKKSVLSAPLLLCFSFLMFCSEITKGQDVSGCLCLPQKWPPNNQNLFNSSLSIDTCGILFNNKIIDCDSIYWRLRVFDDSLTTISKGRLLSKKNWRIYFKVDAVKLPWAPFDSTIYATLEDFDKLYPNIKTEFINIYNKIGSFKLKKRTPDDTLSEERRTFLLEFDEWVSIVNVNIELKKIPEISFEFAGYPNPGNTSIVNDPSQSPYIFSLNHNNTNLHISSNAEPIINYAIYNLQGNAIAQSNIINYQNALDIDISALSNGIYFLRINTHISKFIINR